MRVGREEDGVRDVAYEEVNQIESLGRVALPAVVGERIELLDRDLVDDHLPDGRGGEEVSLQLGQLRGAEQCAAGVVDAVEACLRGWGPERGR